MRFAVTFLIVYAIATALAFIIAASAYASCDHYDAATPRSTCVADVMIQGQRGVWFNLLTSAEIKRDRQLIPMFELQVDGLTRANALYGKEVKSLRDSIHLLEDTQKNLQGQLVLANKDAREARAELADSRNWYNNPVFWGIAMFAAGGGVVYAVSR